MITLLTDFGPGSEYVGALHAVIAAACPRADRIDLSHDIPAGDVRFGALVLARLLPLTPVGVHLAVVDPGVGSARLPVALRCADGRVLVGPDNGLLQPASERFGVERAIALTDAAFHRPAAAATFHGRDIFAPAAAYLAAGGDLDALGPVIEPAQLVACELPRGDAEPGRLDARIAGADRFGNVELFASADDLALAFPDGAAVTVTSAAASLACVVGRTFADVAPGAGLVHVDSHGHAAVAISGGSAQETLIVGPGDRITIRLDDR